MKIACIGNCNFIQVFYLRVSHLDQFDRLGFLWQKLLAILCLIQAAQCYNQTLTHNTHPEYYVGRQL